MLIKTLDLRNFQKHKSLSLKFSKYLTVIKGTSGIGKSAILRSLFQLVDESIPWSACHTWDTNDTRIKITGVSDKKECTIERIHSTDTNEVIVDGKSYAYVGKSAPEILKKKLNIREQNIQKQKDFWFLIDMKPGHLSKELNSVSGLNIIDASIQEVSSRVRTAQAEIRILKGQAVVLEKEISALDYVDEADIDLKILETAEKTLFNAEDYLRSLRNKADELESYLSQKKESPDKIEKMLIEVDALYHKVDSLYKKYTEIKSLHSTYTELLAEGVKDFARVEEDFNEVQDAYNSLIQAKEYLDTIRGLESTYTQYLEDIEKYKNALVKQEEMLARVEEQMKICPMCKRPL